MTPLALVLILFAAVIHATWNLLAKRSQGGEIFVWMFTTLSSLFLVPAAVILLLAGSYRFTSLGVLFLCGTSALHLVYFLLLQRGYRSGDLSLVYPLARGLGPCLATLGAIVVLQERPSLPALMGLALVVLGVILLTVRSSGGPRRRAGTAIVYGILIGIIIAVYTVWDKYAVGELAIPPLVLESFAGLGICLVLTPRAATNWPQVREIWRTNRIEVVGVAALAPLSYILVLVAMSFTPLSYVAPAREISILFATFLGVRFLGESHAQRRFVAALAMAGGVIALAAG